jgi:hypothetical protein
LFFRAARILVNSMLNLNIFGLIHYLVKRYGIFEREGAGYNSDNINRFKTWHVQVLSMKKLSSVFPGFYPDSG